MNQSDITDFVEIYDTRENSWCLFEIGLSSPRWLMTTLSTHKDRVLIVGGIEKDGKESVVVEEIDFIKRSLVNLAPMNRGRAGANIIHLLDSLFVFGGGSLPRQEQKAIVGEQYSTKENKWRSLEFEGSF